MSKRDPRIDAYIAKSADFAKPILAHIRELVHAGCPDVEETFKWSFPHFMHKGILCSMASFKAHCTFGFWKGSLVVGKTGRSEEKAMGQFGRITSPADLPKDTVIIGYVREAARLNDEGVKPASKPKPKAKKDVVVPPDLAAALKKNRKAAAAFEGFTPSHKREYVDWITEAKREETRARRLAEAIKWMAEGKPRHWKYVNC